MNDSQAEVPTKRRVTVSLDPAVIPIGEGLASADRRSFSNLLEVLIVKEYERRKPQPTPAGSEVGA